LQVFRWLVRFPFATADRLLQALRAPSSEFVTLKIVEDELRIVETASSLTELVSFSLLRLTSPLFPRVWPRALLSTFPERKCYCCGTTRQEAGRPTKRRRLSCRRLGNPH
jgi:hypothetical protein